MYGETSILKLMIFSGVEHTYQAWDGVPKDSLATHRHTIHTLIKMKQIITGRIIISFIIQKK